jgi:hypothetical protein
MTEQHRATPEQWEHVEVSAGMKQQIPWATADCLLELRSRIEALEADQLEQAESHRFCVDAIVRRVEALELAHRIQSGTLTSAERAELGVVTRVQLEAAMLRSASDARQAAMDELRAWRPLDIETTYGSEAAADAAQILHAPMVVEGTFEHGGDFLKVYAQFEDRLKATPERDPAMTELRAASAEARPAGGLVERVANAIYNVPHDSAAEARAAIREVAQTLRASFFEYAADWLEQEANRG